MAAADHASLARTRLAADTVAASDPAQVIAFYLPQFHPIAENDVWWGKGFTEWTNVARARPLFRGHVQPRFPTDLGYCDLRVPDTRAAQAELAASHGISAFCYYHYWFGGRRLLQRPFDEVLHSGEPRFPFLLCWANENWTRRWDGLDSEILVGQNYSAEDDRAHMRWLAQAFADPRYVRIAGKPLFLVYRTEQLPDPRRTADTWRDEAHRLVIGEISLGRIENFGNVDPRDLGFDFAVEFAPRWTALPRRSLGTGAGAFLRRVGVRRDAYSTNAVYSYADFCSAMKNWPIGDYPLFRSACPGWDNSPRRQKNAVILDGADPEIFRRWLDELIAKRPTFEGVRAPVFVNSWNEWGEGAQLEPCSVYGRRFLDAVKAAVGASNPAKQ
jgi:lipopolysaccharide biosynthesis protein